MPNFIHKLVFIVLLFICPFAAKGQVTANFTVDHTSGCVPLVVHFNNTSTGATSYSWDLGNSTTSLLPSPSGSYVTAGTYTVTLTASNGAVSATHTAVITVYPLPVANFSTTDTAICPGVSVAFTNSSVAGMPGGMTYSWNFGDGATSTLSAPTHPYSTAGYYNITLYATNGGGCTNSFTRTAYVHVFAPPIAGFSTASPNVCTVPATMPFTNSSTGTAPLTYLWTFGDASTATTTAPSHSYTTPGSYTVKLKVTDGHGCKDSMTRPSYIFVGNLTAAFTSSSEICVSVPLSFTNTSSPHISSLWKFGDGYVSTDENPSHTYNTAGTYSAKLIIFNGTCYDSVVHTITIYPKPVINFSVNPAHPCPPPIAQTFTASMPAGSTAAWTFGDGGSAPGGTATHTFTTKQITPVDLTVTDTHGCIRTMEKIDTVANLVLDISSSGNEGCIPLTTTLTSIQYSYDVLNRLTSALDAFTYPYPVVAYTWNFGDGSPTSSSPTPTHTYTSVGTFVVSCTIVTANGCTRTSTYVIKTGAPPVPSFTATPAHACAHRPITFTSTSTGSPDTYSWDFGDGESGGGSSPTATHAFAVPGTYSVGLTALQNGCPSPLYLSTVVIDSPGAQAGLHYLCSPFNGVQFYDFSVGATSRVWLFGDGGTSALPNPTHNYPGLTTYNVRLATFNAASGCRDTSAPMAINLVPISHAFTALDTTVCQTQLDTLIAAPAEGGPVVDYRWLVDGVLAGPSHDSLFYIFATPGYRTVRLITTDFRGCHDTLTKPNYVHVANPVANFTISPTEGCAPLPVILSDISTDGTGIGITYHSWDFGDGMSAAGTSLTATHVYTAAGSYFIQETITDGFGCTNAFVRPPFMVYRPSAHFNASTTSVCAGTPIHFTNLSSDTASLWTFGDGGTSATFSPNHTYTTTGNYTVRLVTYGPHGCSDTLTYISYITVNPAPVAAFTMSDSFAVCPPLNVTFTNTSTSASSYYWTLGDGAFSTLAAPSNPYTTPGFYTIKLAATNSFGCSDTATHGATVFGYTGAFIYPTISGCNPLSVHFSVTLGSVSGVVWDFADGYVSSASLSDTISHIYTTPGAYVPKIILTDTTGCTSYSLGGDTIKVDAIVPAFTVTPHPSCASAAVAFADVSHSYFSTVNSWAWSFGGGATSTLTNPSRTYSTAGTYTVGLTASDGWGCTGTLTQSVTVNPLPGVITGAHTVCQGYTTTLFSSPGTGSWNSGATSVATISTGGVVTGIAPGTANITYTLPTGCLITAIVTVNGLPGSIAGPSSICQGGTATLSSGPTGGTWSSGAPSIVSITASGVVTGVATGSATITYTSGTGCVATKSITVNPLPDDITGPLDICIGAVVTMGDPTPLGTWSSSNIAVATIGTTSGVVSAISNGTSTITYTLPTGCKATAVTTVNTAPPPITGPLTVCGGYSSYLANAIPGGAWSCSPGLPTAMIHPLTGVITGISPGTVTVSYTVLSGCVATAVVTVNPLPSPITGTPQVCAGAATTLADATPGGTWGSSNMGVATISPTGVISGVAPGTTTIIYTIPTGCLNIIVLTVDPLPSPITGPDTVCEGGTVLFADAIAGGEWTSADTSIAHIGLASGILGGITNGTTLISYTLSATGCYATKPITVNAAPASITGPASVCVGSSAAMLCAIPGGIWTSSNPAIATIATSGLVTGLPTGGIVTITYTLPTGGCLALKTMTINPLPPVHSVTGGGSYCAGGNGVHIGLDGSDPGMSYGLYFGSSATAYITGTGTTLDFGLLTIAGLYTVQATDTTTGCQSAMTGSATVAITPNLIPSVTIAGPMGDTVCSGVATTFVLHPVNEGTAPTYQWKVNGILVWSGSSYSFLPAGGDVITVKMTSNAICVLPDTAIGSLTIISLPSGMPSVNVLLAPNDTVCEFTTVTFTASSAFTGTGGAYTWFINGATAGTSPTLSYMPDSGDVVRCRVTSNYMCRLADTASSNATTITVEPILVPHVTVSASPGLQIEEGTTVTLTATVTDGGSHSAYQWYVNGIPVPAATTNTYVSQFNDHDTITCRVTSSGVCPDTSSFDRVFIRVKPVSVTHNIGLYPNPNNGTFMIKGNLSSTIDQVADIEIVNILGQRLLWGRINVTKGRIDELVKLPNTVANGMYLLKLIATTESETFHVIISR
jgi:PKD repeat protein